MNKNSSSVLVLFWLSLIFQVTVLKFIWSIETISRIINVSILLVIGIYGIYVLLTKSFSKRIWIKYMLPGILILSGMTLNILINANKNPKIINQLGLVLPWLIFLIIPVLRKKNLIDVRSLWKYTYYFLLVVVILGLSDYFLIYRGVISTKVLETPNGTFLGGAFSLLYMLKDGSPYFRFYACFAEPGSLSMMLLPFIAYAFLKKHYIGLFILLVGWYFSFSLGGMIGFAMLVLLLIYYKAKNKNNKTYTFFLTIAVFIIIGFSFNSLSNTFTKRYESKGNSATVREENFSNSIKNFSKLIINYPLGLPLSETTEEAMSNKLYVGTNFIPIIYLQTGGMFAFLGYILILFVSLKASLKIIFSKQKQEIEYSIVAFSILIMFLFLFQRTTIWESTLFSFLYAPVILDVFEKSWSPISL